MSKSTKFFVFGGIVLIAILGMLFSVAAARSSKITTFEECEKAGWLVRNIIVFDGDAPIEKECVLWSGKHFVKQRETAAVQALRHVVDIANEESGIKSGAVFNFEVIDTNGRSANFGIWKTDTGERIAEERMVIFHEIGSLADNVAEVDFTTNRVVAMHRSPVKLGAVKPIDELEAIARRFLGKIGVNINEFGTLDFSVSSKGTNSFFRWQDNNFALPKGLEVDLTPFIQVGITSDGFIFSYDNTMNLYHNLSKSALREICGLTEIPQHDDDAIDPQKGIAIIFWWDGELQHNRRLYLPYEPETDFAGCSESAKEWLRHLP